MKKVSILFLSLALLLGSNAIGQISYNPFTQNIHFEPEPSVQGFPCGTVQTVAFTQGLTTADDATQWQANPLTVSICLTGFQFNGPASSVVTGSYASNFDWAYDAFAPNCIFGTQKQTLPGTGSNPVFPNPLSSGDIKLSLIVPATSPIGTILAVNVNLQVPGYMQQFNSTPDDNEATQTQTYCALVLSGNVYNDNDSNNNVNGVPIYAPSGTQLYVSLVGSNKNVIASVPVNTDGTYEFTNVTPYTDYSVVLDTVLGITGQPAPIGDLPTPWVNTGEDCCDKVGNDGNANGTIDVSVTNFSKISVDFGIKDPTPTGSLPMILKNFFVSEYNCGGLLSWTTSQEQNTSHVEIYRKEEGQAFRKIATVQSAGHSNVDKIYSFLDKDVQQHITYEYQLKFVDIDGQFTISDIKTLNMDCSKESTSINIFPNPATSELNILYVTEEDNIDLTVAILDMTGRTIMTQTKEMKNGGNVITLDINSIANGTYLLHYQDADGITVGAEKFVKH